MVLLAPSSQNPCPVLSLSSSSTFIFSRPVCYQSFHLNLSKTANKSILQMSNQFFCDKGSERYKINVSIYNLLVQRSHCYVFFKTEFIWGKMRLHEFQSLLESAWILSSLCQHSGCPYPVVKLTIHASMALRWKENPPFRRDEPKKQMSSFLVLVLCQKWNWADNTWIKAYFFWSDCQKPQSPVGLRVLRWLQTLGTVPISCSCVTVHCLPFKL